MFFVVLHGEQKHKLGFAETQRKFITAKLSIRKLELHQS